MRIILIISLSVCLLFSYSWIPLQGGINNRFSRQTTKILKNKLQSEDSPTELTVNQEVISATKQMIKFYQEQDYNLAWFADQELIGLASIFLQIITRAKQEGLQPADYHYQQIENLIDKIKKADQKDQQFSWAVKLDLLLTDAFFNYSSHLLLGVNQAKNLKQTSDRKEVNLIQLLEKIVKRGQVKKQLDNLKPKQLNYKQLQQALIKYRKIASQGGWPSVFSQDKLKKGDYNQQVARLRKRLIICGDLAKKETTSPKLFDAALQQAVRKFQYRHGLEVTGIVGKETVRELNISVAKRIEQLKLNLDRLRQLPRDLGSQYIFVNIPDFQLKVKAQGKLVRTMKVIVGKPTRQTPVFSDQITYLVFNPYWNIPRRIAVDDLLPILQESPNYLARKNIEVFAGEQGQWNRINPEQINWSQVTADNFNYKFRQQPGPKNALGQVKFIFPNQYSIYLHDTPAEKLFERSYRACSSGCVRLNRPVKLARYLLRNNHNWTSSKVKEAVKQGGRVRVEIKKPVPVYLVYLTAWVNEDGTLQFRNDIYAK